MIRRSEQGDAFVLTIDGRELPFRVELRDRKSLAISVTPNLDLQIRAPKTTTEEQVLARIVKRAGWISRQCRFFEAFLPPTPAPRFISGETHLYLGRQYRLKVESSLPERVRLEGRYFWIQAEDVGNGHRIGQLLERWYRAHAMPLLFNRLQRCIDAHPVLQPKVQPRIVVRRMENRWGSCTKAGTILINLELIRVPLHCIDYVLVHELCHLRFYNHSPAFYELLARCLPDWERRKRRLDEFVLWPKPPLRSHGVGPRT